MKEEEVKKFYDFITTEKEDNVFYLSYIARSKYLTEEERHKLKLKSCQMDIKLHKKTYLVNRFSDYVNSIKQFEQASDSYLDNNGNPIPKICKVIYGSIIPVDILAAMVAFKGDVALMESEHLKSCEDISMKYLGIPRMFTRECMIHKKGNKIVDIDVDIDIDNLNRVKEYFNDSILEEYQKYYIRVVKTCGGFHLLFRRATFSRFFNPKTIVSSLETYFPQAKEIKVNENAMCPIPGTMQNEKLVKIYQINEL